MSPFSTVDGAAQLLEAIKLFLDTASSAQMDAFLNRLQPYRTEMCPFWTAQGTIEYKNMLIIEELVDSVQSIGFSADPNSGPESEAFTTLGAGQYASTQGSELPHPSSATNHAVDIITPEPRFDATDILSLDGNQGLLYDSVCSQNVFTENVFDAAVDTETATAAHDNTVMGNMTCFCCYLGPNFTHLTVIPTDDLVGTKRVSARERRGFQLSFRNYIREDAITLLTRNIPQWSKEGLWHEKFAPGGDLLATPGEGGLAHVYSCICRFESRMGNDAIRTRAAMVILQAKYDALIAQRLSEQPCIQGARRGRGYASVMVDRLLQSIHPGWETANKEHKAELRAKFHERKRYGKRWSVLTTHLGYGILFLASSELAAAV
ncbi:hypothetical protein A9K55_000673 [Cordyceps militaris]|uniref:Uncharacterized protein n=1 Tax=Cordyceps militaris TaxID=73501 RepID=A0A2H4STL4_CORMI|nr:hypothetical protein A9K55_000673 [Cordyceps militaris]